jgi:hypothetical protein
MNQRARITRVDFKSSRLSVLSLSEIRLVREAESRNASVSREAYCLVWSVLALLFRSRVSLQAEILILRHQLNIQRRHAPKEWLSAPCPPPTESGVASR